MLDAGIIFFVSVVFLVKKCIITISPKKDIRHPVRGSSHLLTDYIEVNAGAAFYYQFIVDVPDDKAMGEGSHGIAEYIPADSLNNTCKRTLDGRKSVYGREKSGH